MTLKKQLIVIVGPTAVGKTALAIKVANHFNTAIISADSRQFYTEMNIGTAKPSNEELAAAKHYFIDSHHIHQTFSVGDFEQQAIKKIDELFLKHDTLVMVGGSGLYINAVLNGLDEFPQVPEEVRTALNNRFLNEGIKPLQDLLKEKDPDYFAEADVQNPQRIIRALEVIQHTGNTFTSYRQKNRKSRSFSAIKIGLNINRDQLYQQINYRVDEMIANGLVDEVRSLEKYRNVYALKTVGYQEIFDYLDHKITLEKAIDMIKQNTRRFAKRQITWFKKDTEITWFEPTDYEEILKLISSKTTPKS